MRGARRPSLGSLLVGSLLALALGALACSEPGPNLVLVTFDTTRADHVGPRGERGPSLTPHVDAIAATGRVFSNAFTTMPTTAPAHASMLTGLATHEHGIQRNGERATDPEVVARALQRRLGDAGYATGAFLTARVFDRDAMGLGGFDEFDIGRRGLTPGAEAVAAALAWAEGQSAPFFLWLHLYDPHAPYGSAEYKRVHYPVDLKRYGWVEPEHYATPAARAEILARYEEGVRDADAAFGALRAGLAELARGGPEPFYVVTADHGELLAEELDTSGFAYAHGATLGPEVLRVPLVVAGPGVSPGLVTAPATVRDVYTTLLGAAGLVDSAAAEEGRADLRGELPADRLLAAARREFTVSNRRKRELGPEVYAYVRAHAVAASDGEQLVVVAEDGSQTAGSDASPDLLDLAAATLEAMLASRADGEGEPLDEETRDQLRALGYVE